MKRFLHRIPHTLLRSTLGALCTLALMTGCSNAMTSPHSQLGEGDVVRNTFPLKFKEHNFGSHCFNTIGCKVLYNNYYDSLDEENEVSPPPPSNYPNSLNADTGPIENFPSPAVVTWRSLDGVSHEAKVDIGSIFNDQRVLHHVPEDQIPTETAAFDGANIILVVNDRTISVYMKTTIALKMPRDPSNPRSNRVHEMNLAYTHTY